MQAKDSKEVNFEELRFIRVFTPIHIPKELIEQVRDREYSVEDWYKYQETICTRKTDEGMQLNPLSLLYVIADGGNKVVGMLWCEIDPLAKDLVVQTFSMDKKYWCRGRAVGLLADKAKQIARECKLKTIVWFTNYPKHSERYGFKRSKSVLMEWKQSEEKCEVEDGEGHEGRSQTQGECTSDDSRATEAII